MLDHLGSPIAVVDQSGSVLQGVSYDAYGNSEGAIDAPVGFANSFADPDSGMLFMQSRWYSPQIRRFVQMDSAAPQANYTNNFNRYVYSSGDPVNRIDRNGQLDTNLISLGAAQTITRVVQIGGLTVTGLTGAGFFTAALLPGGAFNGENQSLDARFLKVGVISGTLGLNSGAAGFGITAGLERLNLERAGKKAIYFYLGLSASIGKKISGNNKFSKVLRKLPRAVGIGGGVSVALIGYSEIFNVANERAYTGIFTSVSGSITIPRTLAAILGGESLAIVANSRSASLFWSPIPSFDEENPSSWGFRVGKGLSTNSSSGASIALDITNYELIGTNEDLPSFWFKEF